MIQEGLLWFDDSATRPLADKIERAVQRYEQKYGHKPDVCYIHPGEGEADPEASVKVLPAKSVLPHHFWLGMEIKGKKNEGIRTRHRI
jgi:hypothetical protein